ncbi:MAG: long-chain fatty acid--CoA ligase [Myxococcales bacterium]|nr:long-chain fatty acid--CoA ligase [Myxococcales bacterium]
MSLNLATLLRTSARRRPHAPAVALGPEQLDYGALDRAAQRFAGGLRRLGVARGAHVALLLPNVPEFTIAYFGCHLAGCPVVPINALSVADEVAYYLADSEARVLVAWEGLLPAAESGCARTPGCERLVVVRAPGAAGAGAALPDGALDFEALCAASAPEPEIPDTRADDTAVLLYTSGTTGRPKGAELTHVNLLYNADVVARLFEMDAGSVSLAVLPLFHSFGQTVMQNATLLAGGKLVLLPRFDAGAAFAAITAERVTLFAGVPTMYFALLHHPDADRYDLGTLRTCVSGGAPMPVEVMRTFDAKYGVNILEGYGLSETSPVAASNVPEKKKAGSIGVPLWGVELRLVDAAGQVIEAANVPGEIHIKGHNVMKGYYRRPDATAEAIRDGWFATGDVAVRDLDGYYFIVDRKKDMILRGGFNVYPREVEEVLYQHPAVLEAAVVGVPHESLGEEVKAVVALKPGASATVEELILHCKAHVAAYKYPRSVELRASLPKGPTGKILKRELR